MKDYVFDEYGTDPDRLTLPVEQDHHFDFDAYFSPAQCEELNGSIFQAFAKNAGDHDEIFYYNGFAHNISNLGVNCSGYEVWFINIFPCISTSMLLKAATVYCRI